MDMHSEFVWRRKLEKLAGKLQQNMMDAIIVDSKEVILLNFEAGY